MGSPPDKGQCQGACAQDGDNDEGCPEIQGVLFLCQAGCCPGSEKFTAVLALDGGVLDILGAVWALLHDRLAPVELIIMSLEGASILKYSTSDVRYFPGVICREPPQHPDVSKLKSYDESVNACPYCHSLPRSADTLFRLTQPGVSQIFGRRILHQQGGAAARAVSAGFLLKGSIERFLRTCFVSNHNRQCNYLDKCDTNYQYKKPKRGNKDGEND
jgi:hypothetical protein